jgi:hypothetical protein
MMVSNGDVEIAVVFSLDEWEEIHNELEADGFEEYCTVIRKQVRNGLPYTDNWYDEE